MNVIRQDSFELTVCRGATDKGCLFSILPRPGLADELAGTVRASGWPELLARIKPDGTKGHDRLRLAVAACPNGCSRPHIVDFAFVAALCPVPPRTCSMCGLCLESCPDRALSIPAGGLAPVVDMSLCLACGRCIQTCPEDLILSGPSGLRFLAGGRLGRRPRLAVELPGLWTADEAPSRLAPLLTALVSAYRPGLRSSDVIMDQWPGLVSGSFR